MEAPATLSPSFPSTNPSDGPSIVHSPVIYKIAADTGLLRDDFAGDGTDEVEVVTYDAPHEKGGLLGGFVNLLTGAIGVGILSFPFAFKSAGLVGISVLSIAFAFLNAYTLWLLARYAQRHAAHLGNTPTYEVLVRRVLGKRAYVVVVSCILFNTIGALSAFLIVVGDLGHTVLHEWLHDSSVPPFFYSKAFIVLVFCFGVALPLSLFPNMHDLWFSSFLAVASVFVVAGMVIGRGVEACVNGRMENGLSQAEGVEVFNLQLEFFLAVPLVVFSLGCHLQVVPVYHSLQRRKKPWMGTILGSSVVTCVVVYLATGLMGYLRFGDDSQGDILSNFPVDDIMLDVGKLLMAAHISLAYPVNLYPCTKTVQLLLTFIPPAWARFKRALTDDRDEYEEEADNYNDNKYDDNDGKGWPGPYHEEKHGDGDAKPSRLWTFVSHWLITLCMLGVTATLAILLPNIQVVFGLVGSTTAVVLNFVTPALMLLVCPLSLAYDDTALLGINEEEDEAITRSYASSSSLLSSSSSSSSTPLLRPPPSRNLCASAVVERILAMGIISLALLIAICGTGVNIYQNFF